MKKYRHRLPQLRNSLFLTDGGLETTLVFHEQVELPYFAAFTLLKSEPGIERLRRYFETYTRIALEHNVGIVLEAPTWRANSDWAAQTGLRRRRAGRCQPPGRRTAARSARTARDADHAHGDQRQHRSAR